MSKVSILQVLSIVSTIFLMTACSSFQNVVKDISEVQKEGEQFIDALSGHSWQRAQTLLTKAAQVNWDEKKLSDYWSAFESVHGPTDKKTVAGFKAFAGTQGQFVAYNYKVDGEKRPGGLISMKLVMADGKWRIDEMAFQL